MVTNTIAICIRAVLRQFWQQTKRCYFTHPLLVILKEPYNYEFFIYYIAWMIRGLRVHRCSCNHVTGWTTENLCFYSR
jgi:hypothetical protein